MATKGRAIDMLPLLDVFMVVLFVFATVEEGAEEERQEEIESVQRAAAEEIAALERDLDETKETLRAAQDDASKLERDLLMERAKQTPEVPEEIAQAQRESRVLERLLEKSSVVEVHIAGSFADDGAIVHRCCFRDDPLEGSFRPCGGAMGSTEEDIASWLERDAEPLAAALRRSGGTPALTLVQQDKVAAYRIAGKAAQAMRDIFPDRQVYLEPDGPPEEGCAP